MTRSRTALAAIWPPTAAVARQAGHTRISPMQAIRRKCVDCCGHQLGEVRLCEAITCPLWPFRSGRHPYTEKAFQEADSEATSSTGVPVPRNAVSSGIGLQEASFEDGEAVGRDVPDYPCRAQVKP